MWKTILFDLDGTLTDSADGITRCVQYALEKMGRIEPDLDKLKCFVGPPLKEQFMLFGGFTEEEGLQAVEAYRERYETIGIWENRPYLGIHQLLQKLCDRGYRLGVASSKPTYFVEQILERFELAPYFDAVVGSEMDGTRTDKSEVIEEALRQLQVREYRYQVLMVGDKEHDVIGARKAGIPCAAVAYGYGSRRELLAAQPLAILETVSDLDLFLTEGRLPYTSSVIDREDATALSAMKKDSSLLKIWRVLYPVGLYFLCSIAAGLLGLLLSAVFSLVGADGLASFFKGNLFLYSVHTALLLPFLLLFLKRDGARRRQEFEISKTRLSVKTIAIFAVFAMAVCDLLNILLNLLQIPRLFPGFDETFQQIFQYENPIVLMFYTAILAPVMEELVFRGLVFQRIRDYIGFRWALVLSSVIFGACHGNVVQFLYAGILGGILCWLYAKTENIIVPILVHMAANAWSVFLSYLPAESPFWNWHPLVVVAWILAVVWGVHYFLEYLAPVNKKRVEKQE